MFPRDLDLCGNDSHQFWAITVNSELSPTASFSVFVCIRRYLYEDDGLCDMSPRGIAVHVNIIFDELSKPSQVWQHTGEQGFQSDWVPSTSLPHGRCTLYVAVRRWAVVGPAGFEPATNRL